MGADGHIAIYDWEKIDLFLRNQVDHYVPKYKSRAFAREQFHEALTFADEVGAKVTACFKGYKSTPCEIPNDNAAGYEITYFDKTDREPFRWPGYICNWNCNGLRACIVYWDSNLDDPFEECRWLEEWANANALIVSDQEVLT